MAANRTLCWTSVAADFGNVSLSLPGVTTGTCKIQAKQMTKKTTTTTTTTTTAVMAEVRDGKEEQQVVTSQLDQWTTIYPEEPAANITSAELALLPTQTFHFSSLIKEGEKTIGNVSGNIHDAHVGFSRIQVKHTAKVITTTATVRDSKEELKTVTEVYEQWITLFPFEPTQQLQLQQQQQQQPPAIILYAIRSVAHSTYLSALSGGEGTQIELRTCLGPYEKFQLVLAPLDPNNPSDRRYVLLNAEGRLVRANHEGMPERKPVDLQILDDWQKRPWEHFQLVPAPNSPGKWAFKTWHGTYLRAHPGDGATLDLHSEIGPSEIFELIQQ